ncbi:NAD-dependent epimerase/dehydratase family protein [Kangiella shandongensis]|uniref:NAD-dependent epimerase/dehydratase family protein n=1 Tax=Kangiella shandongensis TaxID=2763258 RepID=UPI001CBCBB9E|nr:NAD-dependent epimerase/dehydratase family protein [Kangiella shandongensis]
MYLNMQESELQLLSTKKVLITGARGFVGRHLLKVLDRFSVDYKFIVHERTAGKGHERMIERDSVISEHFDCIIHLAGMAHIQSSNNQSAYEKFYEANVAYAKEMFDKAQEANISRYIYISTIGVYGVYSSQEMITEEHELHPAVAYAKSKLEGERLIKELCLENNIDFVILRPSLVYGEGAPGNLQRLQRICSKKLPLPFGLANEKRTMVSVNNLVSAILRCLHHSAAKNKIFNVADDIGVSTREVCNYYRSQSGKKCYLIPVPKLVTKVLLSLFGQRMLYNQVFGPLSISNKKIKDELQWVPPDRPSDFFLR